MTAFELLKYFVGLILIASAVGLVYRYLFFNK